MEHVTRADVKPLPPSTPQGPEPYRVLFPVGVAAALVALLPWCVQALSGAPWWPEALRPVWPGPAHAAIMMQGFELAFVAGFLLTAMPAFTHGARATRLELLLATLGVGGFTVLRALEVPGAAVATLATLLVLGTAIARRVRGGAAAPPEEFLLVGTGLALGLAGAVVQVAATFGLMTPVAERFGVRTFSLGMLLALVLGLGGLLVPTFAQIENPLDIVGVARAGDRVRRRAFTLAIAALLLLAVNLEFAGFGTVAGVLRAVAVVASTQLAWKLWRGPGRGDRLAWALWLAGWSLVLGFVAAALLPAQRVEAWHVAFVGGYTLLTLAIATRVVVSHGGHARSEERVVLTWAGVVALLAAALVRALGPALDPEHTGAHHALAATLGTVALVLWLRGAWPRVRRTRANTTVLAPPR
jgi:uncharacterized protein involved in response to NO